ncbi:MAG TPA: hypothetical protein VN089_04220 [Duganella sp.]|nr:hypothetical protein [Duganella sp.]
MSDSTLDPDNIPVGTDRVLGRGHGTRSLGPSDNSDSGSDVAGNPDLALDSDTDAEGTGERGDVGMHQVEAGADIGFDHVETIPGADVMVDGDFHDVVPLEEDGSVPDDDVPPDQPLERGEKSRLNGQPAPRQ